MKAQTYSEHTHSGKTQKQATVLLKRGVAEGAATHNGRHVAALVCGRHQRAQVWLAAHASVGGRGALVLHTLGHGAWRQKTRGGAVAAEVAVSWTHK